MSFADAVQISGGQAASLASNTGNPVKVGAVYNLSAPTATTGEVIDAQCDANGNQKVSVVNGVTSGTAGSASAAVLSVQGIASMTPVQTTPALTTSGGASYSNVIAAATPAVTVVKSSAGNIYQVIGFNSSATPVFIHFFDATSVSLGTTATSFVWMIPGNTAGAGFTIPLNYPRSMANAIRYAVTGGIASTDNTSITASSVIVDVSFN